MSQSDQSMSNNTDGSSIVFSNINTKDDMIHINNARKDQHNNTEDCTTLVNSSNTLSIDEFLKNVGQLGRFQALTMLICALLLFVPSMQALVMVFTAHSPPWSCDIFGQTQFSDTLNTSTTCNDTKTIFYEGQSGFNKRCVYERTNWVYRLPKSHSIVSEFDLVCDHESLVYLSNSCLFFGQILGGFVVGWLSDRFGRKKPLFTCSTLLCIISFVSSYSPNIYTLMFCRVVSGICVSGTVISVIVVAVELVGSKYRAFAGLMVWNAWTTGICLMSLQSYYIANWRTLMKVITAPYIILNIGFLFVPESIRWYHSKGRIDDALSVLRNVSKWNKRTFPEKKTLEPFYKNNKIEEGTYLDLFTKKHCLKTLILFFTWFTGDCVYYGISLAFSDLSGHRHRDFVLISLPEIFANLLAIYAVGRIGRKKTTIIGFAVTAIGLMTLGTLMYNDIHYQSLNIVVGMIGKCFGIIAYCSNQILSVESYPTNIRSQAMGLFYVFSQLGGALAPWIAKGLLRYHVTLPLFVLGVFPIIASILALSLKETKGKDIDQQEADEGITENNEQSLNKNETHC